MGDALSDVRSNAYYFKTNKLSSGEHVSRLSIRTISDGYQYHQVNKKDLILKKNNYLLINEGEEFHSEISVRKDVEGILVAFEKSDVLELYNSLSKKEQALLDDPFGLEHRDIPLESQSLELSKELKILIKRVRHGILNNLQHKTYYEEIFMKILEKIFDDQSKVQKSIDRLKCKKKSTRKEIFKRVRRSKDYIDFHFKDDLSIRELSKIATMSSFHYVRSFRQIYNLSPHQYLTKQRLSKAKFLLRDTESTIGDICQQVGLVNSSSFTRLFKQLEGCTPHKYRLDQA